MGIRCPQIIALIVRAPPRSSCREWKSSREEENEDCEPAVRARITTPTVGLLARHMLIRKENAVAHIGFDCPNYFISHLRCLPRPGLHPRARVL